MSGSSRPGSACGRRSLAGRLGNRWVRPTRDCGRPSPSGSTRPRRGPSCARHRGVRTSSVRVASRTPCSVRPDGTPACYLRLTPEEVELSHLMDGTRTLARLVADFARISGRLAPDQVRRVVADLAGNRMLEELPVDAFAPLQRVRRTPWPIRLGRGLLAFIQGRRMVLANVDPLVGCPLPCRRPARSSPGRSRALMATVAAVGLVAFGWQWWTGEQSVFLTEDSYVTGAAVLLGLNVMALACHELGHALATKHAGRRVPAAGFLIYFGIPSVFVDTTDVWMAGRRARLLTTPPDRRPGWCSRAPPHWWASPCPRPRRGASSSRSPGTSTRCSTSTRSWRWTATTCVMDWLEVPNLRARGLAWVAARLRRRPPSW